jgi:hypothetical protein
VTIAQRSASACSVRACGKITIAPGLASGGFDLRCTPAVSSKAHSSAATPAAFWLGRARVGDPEKRIPPNGLGDLGEQHLDVRLPHVLGLSTTNEIW